MADDILEVKGEIIEDSSAPMDEKMRRRLKEDELGRDIIDECRLQLMLKFRFLDLALWKMDLVPIRGGAAYPLATDGSITIYDPPRVIARFKESETESIRDYMHMILHCIFRHPFDTSHPSKEAWSLTADIIAESVSLDLCRTRFPSDKDADRLSAIDEIRMLIGDVLPSKMYRLIKAIMDAPAGQSYRGLTDRKLHEWRVLFERDEHAAWPKNIERSDEDQKSGHTSGSDDDVESREEDVVKDQEVDNLDDDPNLNDQFPELMQKMFEDEDDIDSSSSQQGSSAVEGDEEETTDSNSENSDLEGRTTSDPMMNFEDKQEDSSKEEAEQQWEDISKQIEMDITTFSKEWGEESSSFVANLALVNTTRYDYDDFLRKFMTRTEEMLINPDEFDYVYYTYGMDLYGNMPLVEPLEYKETKRIRDFVIAIDTSESVSGDQVQAFMKHTFQILKSSEDYTTDVNIHIIQSDSRIQDDTVVKDLRDIDRILEDYQIRGFGGTDFRPVFDHVAKLKDMGMLSDLQGMIYFTDGFGTFPEKTPDFDAAFIFVEEEGRDIPPVPPWAMKVVIEEETLDNMVQREDEQEAVR